MRGLAYGVSPVVKLHDRGVVACGDIIRLQHIRVVEHALPLDLPVTDDARIRREPVEIIVDEGLYDLVVEGGDAVEDVVFDP